LFIHSFESNHLGETETQYRQIKHTIKKQKTQLPLEWGRPYWLSLTLKVIQGWWFSFHPKGVCHFLFFSD